MSYIPPGPYRWTINGLVDSDNDLILKPSYPAAINQDKAANLEGFIELLPQYVEDAEDAIKRARIFLAFITSILSRGCQRIVDNKSCRVWRNKFPDSVLCHVCELQAHYDTYEKEQEYLCPSSQELTGSKIA